MALLFEEIDSQPSDLGPVSLRRRRMPALGDRDIYEVKLGDDFLMSSMFVDAEIALADLGIEATTADKPVVVVGGLGLGYTAEAALRHDQVDELLVIEALDTVIGWHRKGLVPIGPILNDDKRCRYVHGSFFELADPGCGFDPEVPGRLFDAILLDIDHSPRALLHNSNASFYQAESLERMTQQLKPDGVFAMWSNEPEDDGFMQILEEVFTDCRAEKISFFNPFQNCMASNTVYIAHKSAM